MNATQEIGIAIGTVVATSLALQTAFSQPMTAMVEAIKATGRVRDGWAGVVSLVIGLALGSFAGLIAWHQVGDPWWLAIGAFAGLLLGAGGISQHDASVGRALKQSQPTLPPATSIDGRQPDSLDVEVDGNATAPHATVGNRTATAGVVAATDALNAGREGEEPAR